MCTGLKKARLKSQGQTRMRVTGHALLEGTFEALDEQNKGLMNVPTMF
jgi:hypothetical protein